MAVFLDTFLTAIDHRIKFWNFVAIAALNLFEDGDMYVRSASLATPFALLRTRHVAESREIRLNGGNGMGETAVPFTSHCDPVLLVHCCIFSKCLYTATGIYRTFSALPNASTLKHML
jgi:hypothetical protein